MFLSYGLKRLNHQLLLCLRFLLNLKYLMYLKKHYYLKHLRYQQFLKFLKNLKNHLYRMIVIIEMNLQLLLFLKFLPAIAMAEVKGVMPQADPHWSGYHAHGAHGAHGGEHHG